MRYRALALTGLCLPALLAACGSSGTRTVSVSDSQSTQASATATTSSGPTGPKPGATGASGPTSATGGTPAATQGGPAFATPGGRSGALSDAESVLQARGFRALDPGDYRSAQTLRVLIGGRQGSVDAHVQQAFFFVNGRFIGTDTSDPSAQIRVASQSDTAITLAYALYRPSDPLCCASGGQATVTYQLDNGRLQPLNPIPSASPNAAHTRE